MVYIETINVRRNWEVCPRGAAESRWTSMYASINRYGDIILSRVTHEAMVSPDSYQLLYARERDVIGLRRARLGIEKNAFPARPRGKHGGVRIRGHKMLREFGIQVGATRVFDRCQLDRHGVLILDLGDAKTLGKPGK